VVWQFIFALFFKKKRTGFRPGQRVSLVVDFAEYYILILIEDYHTKIDEFVQDFVLSGKLLSSFICKNCSSFFFESEFTEFKEFSELKKLRWFPKKNIAKIKIMPTERT